MSRSKHGHLHVGRAKCSACNRGAHNSKQEAVIAEEPKLGLLDPLADDCGCGDWCTCNDVWGADWRTHLQVLPQPLRVPIAQLVTAAEPR